MQNLRATIKKIGALASGALMMGATLGMAAAFDLSDFPSPFVTGGDVASQIVVGSGAMTADVVGGIQIAERLGNLAITSEEKTATAASGASVSVSDGVSLDTANTKLYLGDGTNAARTTLTKTDLPTVLKSGTVSVTGTDYNYDLYLTVGSRTITFGNSGESIDPILYVDVGTGGTNIANYLYKSTIVFNKLLNLSSTSVQGKTITLFNKDYTIGAGSDHDTMVLYGYGITDQFTHGVEKTVTVGGTDYGVRVVLSTTGTMAIYVNGVTDGSTYSDGESTVIGGLNIYLKSHLLASTTDLTENYATLSLGSEKITLDNGNKVKVGQSATSVDGTYVSATGTSGTGMSKLEILVAAEDSTGDYLGIGSAFSDPVYGSFKMAFEGLAPALDAAGRSEIKLGVSGDNAATVTFKDYRGYQKSINFAFDNDTTTTTVTPALTDTNAKLYHVVEGDEVAENEFVLLEQGDFSHIFKVTDIDDVGDSGGTPKVELYDVFSGDSTTIYLEAPGYTNATAYIDGMTYYVNASLTKVKFTWAADSTDAGAGINAVGNITTLFPLIKGINGELITFFNANATGGTTLDLGSTSGIYYEFPGGSSGTTISLVTNETTSVTAGQLTWNFTAGTTTATLNAVGKSGSELAISGYPIVLLLEEKGKNTAGSEVRDAIVTSTKVAGNTPAKMAWNTDNKFTDASMASSPYQTRVSDTYYGEAVDRYGTYVVRYTYDQGSMTIKYPNEQAIAGVAMGADPQITIGGGTTDVTYTESTPGALLADAAWLDTEVTPSIKNNNHLILIGGPAINTLVADLSAQAGSAVWDLDTWRDGAHSNMAQIVLVEDAFVSGKVALVVAGHEADDTRAASKAVATYDVAPFATSAASGVTEITLTSAEYPS